MSKTGFTQLLTTEYLLCFMYFAAKKQKMVAFLSATTLSTQRKRSVSLLCMTNT